MPANDRTDAFGRSRGIVNAVQLACRAAPGSSTPATGPGSSSPHAAPAASLNVELDWVPNPDHVGFYYALNKGYFSRQNLTVNFRVP